MRGAEWHSYRTAQRQPEPEERCRSSGAASNGGHEAAEGQPGSRGESGAGRRMVRTPGCIPFGESGRVAGEAEPGNRGGRAGSRGAGSVRRATGVHGERVGFTAEEGSGSPGRQSAKADRPPKRKLRRAMTLVETQANARRSIGGGSPSDPGVALGQRAGFGPQRSPGALRFFGTGRHRPARRTSDTPAAPPWSTSAPAGTTPDTSGRVSHPRARVRTGGYPRRHDGTSA